MRKKRLAIIAAAAILVIALFVLSACNSFKWDSIGPGNPDADVISNGGYFVRQGDFVYFINGYEGESKDNKWGNAYKQSIMRAKLKADGTIDNDTAKVVAPLNVYNTSADGGIAIFGNFVYYAVPNTEKNKDGVASTKHTNFMRTSLDGTVTQVLGTIESRSAKYIFTPTRVVYYLNNTVSYIDFSGMKTNKSSDNRKGAVTGTLAENVDSVVWAYDSEYKKGQAVGVTDYFFYTQSVTDDESYNKYNRTYAQRFDGSDKRELIGKETYLEEDEKGDNFINHTDKIFKVSLGNIHVDSDGQITLYYTKTADGDKAHGLYMNKFSIDGGFDVAAEKRLTATAPSVAYTLGYDKGAIVKNGSDFCLVEGRIITDTDSAADSDTDTDTLGNVVVSGDYKIAYVDNTYVYFTASSSAKELFKINLDKSVGDCPNVVSILSTGIKTDWLSLEFVSIGDSVKFYFFATDFYNYIFNIDLANFDAAEDKISGNLVGKMTDGDNKAYLEKLEEEEKEEQDKENGNK